ncbi:hypothetical protein M569_09627 [Genlisea aurea]|uniref:Uncharacterized protein n=1 Tax=Genlisea aurea TaxID=192259 RepID=S8CKD6_9LAMI|nr:hypothetical protein M569_09627 [Genlisea aurea]
MDANEFRQLLELFPVVRPRDYHADDLEQRAPPPNKEVKEWQEAWDDTNNEDKGESSRSNSNNNPGFWDHLRSSAERKMGMDAERFCDAFQRVYKKFVYEELTSEAAARIVTALKKS